MSVKHRIYLSSPHMGGTELKYITRAFETNWISSVGPNIDAFEKLIEERLCIKHAAALSSGTAAIHLALIIMGVGPGDYVLVQDFTFSATINPIVYLGATPVLIDSEPHSWNMDPDLLEKAILDLTGKSETKTSSYSLKPSACRLPKAIIPVHLYGMPANMSRIMEISEKYGIPVMEDAAESLGSRYKGKPVGTFGKMGVHSFNGNKIITTSGGGALVSDNHDYITKARFLSTQARDKAPHYQHSQIGYNYRMSNIIAGVGRGQMEFLDQRIDQRRSIYQYYKENLSGIDGISFLEEHSEDYFSNRWLTTILIDPEKTGTDKDKVRHALEEDDIETRPLWKPMHMQPIFAEYPAYTNGVSEELFSKGLCLPSGTNMSDEDKARVIKALRKAFGK